MLSPLGKGLLRGRGAGAAAWTPESATDGGGVSPHTWHYAGSGAVYTDAGVTLVASNGDPVGRSVNQGSDNHNVNQTTAGSKPTYQTNVLNGHPVFRFDGSDDFLQGAFAAGLTQPHTVFVVAKLDAAAIGGATDGIVVDSDDSANRMAVYHNVGANPDAWSIYAGLDIRDGEPDSNWNIWNAVFNGASSVIRINGDDKITGNAGAGSADGLTIGERFTPGRPWDGDVAEVIIYDSALSAADRAQVETYLSDKYAINLA